MQYLNKHAVAGLTVIGLVISGSASAKQRIAGAPAVAPVGDVTPPAGLPNAAGPSGTSGAQAGSVHFDDVGYASLGAEVAQDQITATGIGLPRGYAEVTSLVTGRTVLVKTAPTPAAPGGFLVTLSGAAARLLGFSRGAPAAVRVRQVQPIAADEVALEQGRPAAARLDAPEILLNGLRAQLANVPSPVAVTMPASLTHPKVPTKLDVRNPAAASKTLPANVAPPKVAPTKAPPATPASPRPMESAAPSKSPPTTAAQKAAAEGHYRVQVASFSSEANAKKLAGKIGGQSVNSGKFWRVELGPFADHVSAKRARDGIAKRGYADARVLTN